MEMQNLRFKRDDIIADGGSASQGPNAAGNPSRASGPPYPEEGQAEDAAQNPIDTQIIDLRSADPQYGEEGWETIRNTVEPSRLLLEGLPHLRIGVRRMAR